MNATRMRAFAVAACLALAAGPGAAQDEAARMAAAEAYVALPAVQQMIEGTLDPDALIAQFRATVPVADQLTEEQFETLARIATEEIGAIRPQMMETMRDQAAETFTLAELEALTAFYASPEGASILGKTGPFMRSYMQALSPTLQETMRTISERIQAEIMP
jgi:hypothetical protein